jgi:hypothetical protein
MVAFFYVLISGKDYPLAVYVLIGGMAGLPSIWSLQSILNDRAEPTDEPTDEGSSPTSGS